MSTPEEKLEKMLKDFEATYKTATTNPGKNLRDIIESTPELKANMLESIKNGNLEKLEAFPGKSPLGYYRAETDPSGPGKTLAVSIDQLNDAATKTQTANSLRFTLGHENKHAIDRQDIVDQDKLLRDQAKATAKTPSPHDYTDELKAYNATSRKLETAAEIEGFNTLASYVTSKNPKATLKDLYDASPDDMRMYIKEDLSKSPPTYTARDPLKIGPDLKVASTPENAEAVGKLFYDAVGYPKGETKRAIGMIQDEEAKALAEARKTNPTAAAPEIRVDLKTLALPGVTLPPGFTDSSRPRLQADQDTGQTPVDRSGPKSPSHQDNSYFEALRDKLPATVPDNAVAHAMAQAKLVGMTDFSKVNPDEVGLSNGKIWIGGNAPGIRVGVDVAQSPPMEQVAKDLSAMNNTQRDSSRSAQQPPSLETSQPSIGSR
jgi:hypothetical protein